MLKQLDKIGDTMGKIGEKLANVVEDFQKKQSSRCYIIAMYNCIGIGTQNRQTSVNFQ